MNRSITLSATTRWILTVLVLGVGVILVVILYAQQQTRNSRLNKDVDSASATLVSNSIQRSSLEANLLEANLDLTQAMTSFPTTDQSQDIEETLYKVATDAGVTVTSVNCPAPAAAQVDGTNYQVLTVSTSVTGQPDNLLRFVGLLGYRLPSASIDSMQMSTTGEESTLSIVIKVYAFNR